MAIRIARCMRCHADALVYGPGATMLNVQGGEAVHIGVHHDGNGVSCPGFVGRLHPDYPLCPGCRGEVVEAGRTRHEGC